MSALHVIAFVALLIAYGAAEFLRRPGVRMKLQLLVIFYICLPAIVIAVFSCIAGFFIK